MKRWTSVSFSAEAGADGDGIVEDHEVEFLLAIHGADGGEEHAVGIQAHHLARGEVQDGGDLFSHELFGLVEGVNAGKDLCRRRG